MYSGELSGMQGAISKRLASGCSRPGSRMAVAMGSHLKRSSRHCVSALTRRHRCSAARTRSPRGPCDENGVSKGEACRAQGGGGQARRHTSLWTPAAHSVLQSFQSHYAQLRPCALYRQLDPFRVYRLGRFPWHQDDKFPRSAQKRHVALEPSALDHGAIQCGLTKPCHDLT